jgi:hypothetical protein
MALIEVAAFIMMHSGVDPSYKATFFNESNPYDSYYQYELTGTEISKRNIHLYAPSILGYSYYDHQRSEEFLKKMNSEYREGESSYTDYCLRQIQEFEQTHVADTKRVLEKQPPTDDDRELRLNAHDMVTHKQRVEWKEHTHYITEKTYSIRSDDNPKNSIMVCCQKVDIYKRQIAKATEELNKHVKDKHLNDKNVRYELEYDEGIKTCSIRFNTTDNINLIPFTTIVDIIEIFLKSVLSPDIKYELSIFDFTCSEVEFVSHPNSTETPIFISYDESKHTMIYGTNPTEEASKSERDKRVLSYAYSGSASPHRHLLRSAFTVHPGPAVSPSPERPTSTIHVKLDSYITSFVDVNPIVELGGDSISVPSDSYQDSHSDSLLLSPSLGEGSQSSGHDGDGGSRRRRRTIKKVSLRNRRRTKVRSKRSKRQRKTKSKR